jgi:hypothetical protein
VPADAASVTGLTKAALTGTQDDAPAPAVVSVPTSRSKVSTSKADTAFEPERTDAAANQATAGDGASGAKQNPTPRQAKGLFNGVRNQLRGSTGKSDQAGVGAASGDGTTKSSGGTAKGAE